MESYFVLARIGLQGNQRTETEPASQAGTGVEKAPTQDESQRPAPGPFAVALRFSALWSKQDRKIVHARLVKICELIDLSSHN